MALFRIYGTARGERSIRHLGTQQAESEESARRLIRKAWPGARIGRIEAVAGGGAPPVTDEPVKRDAPAVRRGDRFVQRIPGSFPLFVEVIRVGRTGWVDIRCQTWAVQWSKRMVAGIDAMLEPGRVFHLEREDWTDADVLASAPKEDQ
jgi:hypothetical protein